MPPCPVPTHLTSRFARMWHYYQATERHHYLQSPIFRYVDVIKIFSIRINLRFWHGVLRFSKTKCWEERVEHLDVVQSHVAGQLLYRGVGWILPPYILSRPPHKVDMRASCSQTRLYAFCSLYTSVAAYLLMDQSNHNLYPLKTVYVLSGCGGKASKILIR